jgi:hypothetical protein
VVAQFNSTIAVFGNLTKEVDNRVHLRIVVLGDGVQGYQRVEDSRVDLVPGDGESSASRSSPKEPVTSSATPL